MANSGLNPDRQTELIYAVWPRLMEAEFNPDTYEDIVAACIHETLARWEISQIMVRWGRWN